jgi:hypothetical protein
MSGLGDVNTKMGSSAYQSCESARGERDIVVSDHKMAAILGQFSGQPVEQKKSAPGASANRHGRECWVFSVKSPQRDSNIESFQHRFNAGMVCVSVHAHQLR